MKSIRILIVDDLKINRELLKSMLNLIGYSSEQVEDGEAALEYCVRHEVDCILLDINMPKMDGVEVIRRIRFDERERTEIPKKIIVAVTANTVIGDRERYLEEGADYYLSKPILLVEMKKLMARIERRLKSH